MRLRWKFSFELPWVGKLTAGKQEAPAATCEGLLLAFDLQIE